MLARCVRSLDFIDHLVAVDGAYALYPMGAPSSDLEQHEAIAAAAAKLGIGLTLETPSDVWAGNEVEKRNRAFDLARGLGPHWLFLIDADMFVSADRPDNLTDQLAAMPFEVAGVTLVTSEGYFAPPSTPGQVWAVDDRHPLFVRALDGLRCVGAHSVWAAHYGEERIWLRGLPDLHEVVPYGNLSELVVYHTPGDRDPERQRRARVYQQTRDSMGAEQHGAVMMEAQAGGVSEVA